MSATQKVFLTAVTLFVFIGNTYSGSSAKETGKLDEIHFIENSWKAAIKRAAAEKKYIFVDAYAVWCAPCRQLKLTTFKNTEAAALFNKKFVNLSLDMEKGEGLMLSKKWGVEEFPTLLIIDAQGNVVKGNVGFLDSKELIQFANKALAKKN